ncbi:hypothetical protein PVAND_003842 [Polypedilum vanderplanki]|uniref:C2H2-type domain-containing protein n=1 Tax=Polypedilum vanderplanki TaxID=319348 RepID=A0A9J6BVA3_POLVA|nr:hypothetical protein PVAND_003842 [Polypedilum vanderplanki]
MTTLVPTSQNQPGTTTSSTTGVESYEDMFKEITRKLYGDESAHGLYPINNSQVAQLAQTPSAPPEGERSFTTLVSDRNLAQLEYEGVIQTDVSSNFKSEDHLSTAFGLAALMHNGFPPPAVFPVSNVNSSSTKQTAQSNGATSDDQRQWTQQQTSQQNHSQQDETLWTPNKATNVYTQKLFKIKTKQEPNTNEIIINATSASTSATTSSLTNVKSEVQQVQKRYSCSVCPYSTDRRDLFTRHENIHKEEKPFHCYACLKQFNRADHVKKHFLRMHREMDYDINKTRRYPPSSKQIVNLNNNNNNNNSGSNNKSSNNFTFYNQQQSTEPPQVPQQTTTINIPSFTQQQHQTTSSAQQPQQSHNSHSIEHVIQTNTNNQQNTVNQTTVQTVAINIKHEKTGQKNPQKAKGEKRFMCCYCSWSGADNWGLKRHLNTHTKPFVCLLCDYKAARSERLTTHILKVHNKKACNKCSFFADDQAQLTQHQIDTHQNETRPARLSNTTTTTTTNNQLSTQAIVPNQVINQPILSVNTSSSNIAGTGNVLRTLTNTFVPNIQTTSSNNVFGTLNSSLNNGVSTIYTTSNTNNIVEQINHHLTSNNWRTSSTLNNTSNQNIVRNQQTSNTLTFTNSTGTHSAKRKSGAERLFAYFEADDSEDLELDYARQLQMQALSRNTSCVAQDFHNAGGENTTSSKSIIQQPAKGVNSVSCNINRDINLNGTIGQQQLLQQNKKLNNNNKAMSPVDQFSSPPATLELITNSIKRRRKSSSSNDKENVNELLTKQLSFLKQQHQLFLQNLNASHMSDEERLKAISDINEIFESMYRNSLTIISSMENETKFTKIQSPTKTKTESQSQNDSSEGSCEKVLDDYKLPAFLRNNKEITVIMDTNKTRSKVAMIEDQNPCEVRKNRKQLKPKKIEKEGQQQQQQDIAVIKADVNDKHTDDSRISNINNLRDKHMLKLVTKKRCCYLCRNKSIDTQKNTKESLLLHNLWRHAPKKLECHRCEMRFNKLYKLKLHKTLKKH